MIATTEDLRKLEQRILMLDLNSSASKKDWSNRKTKNGQQINENNVDFSIYFPYSPNKGDCMAKRKKVIPAPPVKRREGRPLTYHPGLCDDIIEFFDRPLYIKKIERKKVNGEWVEFEIEAPNSTPYLIKWCRKHKIHPGTPSEWAKDRDKNGKLKYKEFSDAYYTCKRLQQVFLVEHGIKGTHNGFMTNQTLKNVDSLWRDGDTDNWRDKQEVKHSGGVVATNVDVEGKSVEELIRMLNGN